MKIYPASYNFIINNAKIIFFLNLDQSVPNID